MDIPALTTDQMRQVDRLMIEEFDILLLQMMENAGRNLAHLALERFSPASVTVLAGTGGNGGGGLVAARHLTNRGAATRVALAHAPDELTEVPKHQLSGLRAMGVPIDEEPRPADLIVDALIGYSLRGDPRGRTAELIAWASEAGSPILSLDTPSGLDTTTGQPGTPCIAATATLTLALPKVGLIGAPQVGELYLGDISVPAGVYERIGVDPGQLFSDAQVIRLS